MEQQRRKKRSPIKKETLEAILRMKSQSFSIPEISTALELAQSSVYNIISRYEKHKDGGGKLEDFFKTPGPTSNNNIALKNFLAQIVVSDNSLTQIGMVTKLMEEGFVVSQPTVCKYLKKSNISRKRLTLVADIDSTERRLQKQMYSVELRQCQDSQILFLDETGFNLHTSPSYGYSAKNMPAIRRVPKQRGRNVSVFAMISCEKILAYKIIVGPFNSTSYLDFLTQEVLNGNISTGKILVCDNVAFHRTLTIREYLEANGVIYKFLPPYSPDLNPIENVFSTLKTRYYQLRPLPTTPREIFRNVEQVINQMNSDDQLNFANYYSRMRVFLEKAFNLDYF
jgi:transposase